MRKPFRTLIYILLSLGFVIIIIAIGTNFILKNKLENFIENELPENIVGSYSSLSLNLLNSSISATNPSLVIGNIEDGVNHTYIKAGKLKISGISYWNYLIHDEIHISKIKFEDPEISLYKDLKKPRKDSIGQQSFKIRKPIYVEALEVNNAEIAFYGKGKDSTELYSNNLSFKINGIELNDKTVLHKIPLKYLSIKAKGDSTFIKANKYENLSISSFSLENKNVLFNNINFKTKYSKFQLSQIITTERDHYDLSLKSLLIKNLDFGYVNKKLFVKSNELVLNRPELTIFRDKLVADDISIKPLYSQSLRELPFYLTIDSINIDKGFLKYEEKVKEGNPAGSINFKNLDANFLNVSNTYKSPTKTEIKINAIFMDKTPYSVLWKFDVQNLNDDFLFEGNIGALKAEKMNSFTEPNLHIRLEGQLNKTYFTIDGNKSTSKTDMKINYSDFKVSVLKKDGDDKNKFLSAIVNIFISKNSENKDDQYREASAEAERDKTKSIFNFLWLSIQSALQKSLTGNSKE